MARRFTTLITLTLGLLLSTASLFSQETISVDFRVFGVGLDSFEDLYFYNGKKFIPLEFKKTSRSSAEYEYSGAPQITIFTTNPNYQPNDPSIPPYLPLASINLNRSYPDGLLILSANPNNRRSQGEERRYRIFILDDSPQAFPPNSINVINSTGVDLVGRVASETISLPINTTQSVNYGELASNNKPIPIAFALNTSEGLRLTMSNDIPISLGRRVVLILMNPRREGSTRIEVRALIDTISPPEAEGSAEN